VTLLAFPIAGFLAWLHFVTIGRVIVPGVTVWIGWYGVVLAALIWQSWRSASPPMRAGAAIMAASFIAAHVIWNASAWPLATHSLKNIVVAVMLFGAAYAMRSRWLAIAGALHIVIIGFAFAADIGMAFGGRRPPNFIAWSFPDVSAGLQHAALMVCSLGSREHQGVNMELHHRSGGYHRNFGMARVEVHPDEKPREAETMNGRRAG